MSGFKICVALAVAAFAVLAGMLLPLFTPIRSPCDFSEDELPSAHRAFGPGGPYENATGLQRHVAYFDLNLDYTITLEEMFITSQMANCLSFRFPNIMCRPAMVFLAWGLGSKGQGKPSQSMDMHNPAMSNLVHSPSHSGVYNDNGDADLSKVDAFFAATDLNNDGSLSQEEVDTWIEKNARSTGHKFLMGIEFPVLVRMQTDLGSTVTLASVRSLFDATYLFNFPHEWRGLYCHDGAKVPGRISNDLLERVGETKLPSARVQTRADVVYSMVQTPDLSAAEQATLRTVVDKAITGGIDTEAPHLRYLMAAIRLLRTMYLKAAPVKPGHVRVPKPMGPVQRLDKLVHRMGERGHRVMQLPFEFAADDEDFPGEGFGAEMTWKLCEHYGTIELDDNPQAFSSSMEAEVSLHVVMDLFYPRRKYQFSHHNGYAGSDEALTQFFFFGSGASLLERIAGSAIECKSRLMNVAPLSADEPGTLGSAFAACVAGAPKNAAYVVDLVAMTRYAGREASGVMPYGFLAAFDASQNVMAIFVGYMARWVRPGDPEWAHAKYVARTSVVCFLTLIEHLLQLHLIYSNPVQLFMREELPADHPLRRLLKPFVFRSGAINSGAAKSLLPPLSMAHRGFGLQYDALVKLMVDTHTNFKPIPFPESVLERNLRGVPLSPDEPELPYVTDGNAVYDVLIRYVKAYAAAHMPNTCVENSKSDDKYLANFWTKLQAATPGLKPFEGGRHLCDYVATFMFAVTANHELVGDLAAELSTPYFFGKIRKGETMVDIKTFFQGAILMGVTSTPMPRMVEHYPQMHISPKASELHENMLREMSQISATIREKNLNRRFPFMEYDPVELEASISV